MALAMHASSNDYTARHHHSDYSGLTPHATSTYFSWHEPSHTSSSTAPTRSQRTVMHNDGYGHVSDSTSSTTSYNSQWGGMHSSSSSENNYSSSMLTPTQVLAANRAADSSVHGLSYRNVAQPTSLHLPTESTFISHRESLSRTPEGSDIVTRRSAQLTATSESLSYSTTLATASWDDGLIPFDEVDNPDFSGDLRGDSSSSPTLGPTQGRSQVKTEPNETNCQFILETYSDDSVASPILSPISLDASLSSTSSKNVRYGRGSAEAQPRRSNTVPLRATNATPEMYAMMGVIRLDPFACVNGVPQNKNVPSLWNGEPRPLDEEPVLLEWQADLLEPLVPQTPESEYAQLPEVESEDGYDIPKLDAGGQRRERLRSPPVSDWRESVGSGARMSTSSRGSASPVLRLLHGPKTDGICRSPSYHPPRGMLHAYLGRRDFEGASVEFSPSAGSSPTGYAGMSTVAKPRGQLGAAMDEMLDQSASMVSSPTNRSRDASYISPPPQLHMHQNYNPSSFHVPHAHSRQRSDSHTTMSHTPQGSRMSLYESAYPALHPHSAQPYAPLMSQSTGHVSSDVGGGTYGYTMM